MGEKIQYYTLYGYVSLAVVTSKKKKKNSMREAYIIVHKGPDSDFV